jgi:hypothetical protein
MKVLGGVAARRRVAASDVAADQTHSQLDGSLPGGNALLARPAQGLEGRVGKAQVFTLRHEVS